MANKSEGGVKKGAWTKEEDHLLRKCIDKYGEGKWHRVPLRSGLNRCRQSCRLRWLNYLKPNLKRGHFTKDEVDLILRLHKLLGNRWSLIAGRLPGRTANDVKNFWNTHISRKSAAAKQSSSRAAKSITHSNIIRPRPRTLIFPESLLLPRTDTNPDHQNQNHNPHSSDSVDECQTDHQLLQEEIDDCIQWWSSLLETTKNVQPFSESCAGNCSNSAEVDGLRCLSVEALMSGTW